MVPQLIARVDGLPVSLLERGVVWPAPDNGRQRAGVGVSPRLRARIERQTAVVHECRLPAWARALAEPQVDAERVEIRAELVAAGLL
ncbi:MAG: hypothetical protein ABSG43_08295 [Solirubrobacteraceae bacterium]|jgi:hypothetical protein